MNETNEPKKTGKIKGRSPRYPSISLRDAVEKARALYKKEGRALVPRQVAVKAWDYKALHGKSMTMLASVAQYGLLRNQSGSVGISEDAFVIIEAPPDSPAKNEALERCLRTPNIFDEILQKHPESLPSDDTLKWDLKQNGFSEQSASTTIWCLRDTIAFIKEQVKDYDGSNAVIKQEEASNPESTPMKVVSQQISKPITGGVTWNFPLLGKTASVSISGGEPVQEEVDLLIKLLQAFKSGLDKKSMDNKANNQE
ncbi:MAG: hypothetical protein NTW93_08350 [Phycisphaerae bacterium]|nr:hypothetical protein [Phycisphaerae bacterium]